MASKSKSVVRIHTRDAIKFMGEYDLLKNIGLGVWHWGLFVNGELTSAISFGTTCFSSHRGFLSKISERTGFRVIQLCRGATVPWAQKDSPSHLISICCKKMYEMMGPLIIVAYANPTLGEVGTIYQACNAIYTGMTDPKGQANYIINGKKMTGWKVFKKYGTRSKERLRKFDLDLQVQPLNPKHRYLFLACSKLKKKWVRKLLEPYLLPYPKKNHTEY